LRGLRGSVRYEIEGTKTRFSGKKLMAGWLPKSFQRVKSPYFCDYFRLKAVH